MLFVGDDWAEDHHDIVVIDTDGKRLVRQRLPEGVAGVEKLHALIADHLGEDDDVAGVVVGIETDRGPWVQALLAAGYTLYAVNPLQASRYRQRHSTSGTKSDPGDALVLAELVRTDRAHHRPVTGDSAMAEQAKVLARAHQSLIWDRQRQVNTLRSGLREYYPAALAAFGTDLAARDAVAVLTAAPGPTAGARLTADQVQALLRVAGRQRHLTARAEQIVAALHGSHLQARPGIEAAYTATTGALIAVITALSTQIAALQEQIQQCFDQHPDAEIYRSQPGLGAVLGARVLAEFGDDPHRYADARARKNYSGMSPITRASGTKRAVLARYARNRRLGDALYFQAFAALNVSPGARAYYDERRARGATHHQALRAVANRLVGILHGCLHHHTHYDEDIAW
ncbi:IS110 family transposase, partial [Kocuria dechangensis]|uniref:IS110 family transposase n=1 Tax=Kocuria dechangensis TaxID=1176249 RepID=UPI001669CD5D